MAILTGDGGGLLNPWGKMRWLGLLLWSWSLTLPVLAQNIRIREQRYEGRFVERHGQVYVLLQPFSAALGVQVNALGEGYWTGEAPPASVPGGVVQVGSTPVAMLLEGGDEFVPAEAYSRALGFSIRRDAGGALRIEPKVASGQAAVARKLPDDPESFFVTQYPSRYNRWASDKNANCGPACMAMVALAYGVAPEGMLPGDRQALIVWCRQSMTLGRQDQGRGTTCHEIERAATQLGLNSHMIARFQDLDQALARGELVVVAGDTSRIGWGGGDHFLLCVGRRGSDYLINDPGGFCRVAGTRLQADLMEKFFSRAIALSPTR